MDKMSDIARIQFIARDKETNFLRFESRVMLLHEATKFLNDMVQANPEWKWSMQIFAGDPIAAQQ